MSCDLVIACGPDSLSIMVHGAVVCSARSILDVTIQERVADGVTTFDVVAECGGEGVSETVVLVPCPTRASAEAFTQQFRDGMLKSAVANAGEIPDVPSIAA